MKIRINVTIEKYTLDQIQAKTNNVSAFLERSANEVLNGDTKRFKCDACEATWYSVFVPQRCINCGKEAVISRYPELRILKTSTQEAPPQDPG